MTESSRSDILNAGSRPQMASLGNFLKVAAEICNVEGSCMKYHPSNITCSAQLRQKLYDSDDIRFFFILMISVRGR